MSVDVPAPRTTPFRARPLRGEVHGRGLGSHQEGEAPAVLTKTWGAFPTPPGGREA